MQISAANAIIFTIICFLLWIDLFRETGILHRIANHGNSNSRYRTTIVRSLLKRNALVCRKMMKITYVLLGLFLSIGSASEYPEVNWTCEDGQINVTVHTSYPFEGAVMAKGRPKSCVTLGNGNTTTELVIPFGEPNPCRVKYDEVTGAYSVTVDVHVHRALVLDNDRQVDIVCSPKDMRGFIEKTSSSSQPDVASFNLTLRDKTQKTMDAIYGRAYTLEITNSNEADERPFLVTQCRAYGGKNLSVTLTDKRGCPTVPSLITPFQSRSTEDMDGKKTYRSMARIPSMFRFPSVSHVHFECAMRYCEEGEKCLSPCLSSKDSPLDEDDVRRLLNTVDTPVEDGTQEGDEHVATTTVRIVEDDKLKTAAETSLPTAIPCTDRNESFLLYAACIGLSCAFFLGCCCNIICCVMIRRRRNSGDKRRENVDSTQPDYWIKDTMPKQVPPPVINHSTPSYFDNRRLSGASYASVKKTGRLSTTPREYGVPVKRPPVHQSQLSDYGSSSDGREYAASNYGVTNSTFLTHSLTMETDLDSPGSNQATSYH